MFNTLLIIAIALLGNTCKKDAPILVSQNCTEIITNDSLAVVYITSNIADNDYNITEGKAYGDIRISGNCLVIPVSSGGYDKFELIWSGTIEESYPPKTGFILYHENTRITDDLRLQKLEFDLSPLDFMLGSGPVRINLKAYGKPKFNKMIDYDIK